MDGKNIDTFKKPDNYYSTFREDIIQLVPQDANRILDVGCGIGLTGAKIKQMGGVKEVIGIEVVEEAGRAAKERLDRVIIGDLETMTLNFPLEYFDCIICADVLEHLVDPWKALLKLRSYLTNDGVLIASIPNFRTLIPIYKIIFDRFEYWESGILDKTHLRFFTLHTIRKLFEETGFEITKVERNMYPGWKFKLLKYLSLGLLNKFSVIQFLVIVRKKNE